MDTEDKAPPPPVNLVKITFIWIKSFSLIVLFKGTEWGI